jgi:hypothetical protein
MAYKSLTSIIKYDYAMEIVNKGKYFNATKNLICDYCMVSNLAGSWKLLETEDIDLCMNCFIKLRNGEAIGQQSLPVSGRISNNLSDIFKLTEVTLMAQDSIRPDRPNIPTRMVQDSVRPRLMTQMQQDAIRQNENIKTYMIQDSIRPLTRMIQDSVRVQTKMIQDSVREPYAVTKMNEDSVRKPQTNISCYRKNDGKFSFIEY